MKYKTKKVKKYQNEGRKSNPTSNNNRTKNHKQFEEIKPQTEPTKRETVLQSGMYHRNGAKM